MTRLERNDRLWVNDQADGGGSSVEVTVDASLGFCELLQVSASDGRTGTIARKGNGDWWWVRQLDTEEPR